MNTAFASKILMEERDEARALAAQLRDDEYKARRDGEHDKARHFHQVLVRCRNRIGAYTRAVNSMNQKG